MDSARKKKPLLHHHHHHRLPQIAEEILFEEILPRLPVKSLLRFRCVSKSWLSLIESDRFIKTQYQNSTKNPSWAYYRVVLSPRLYESNGKLGECSLRQLMRSNEGSSSIDDLTTVRKECVAVGCYNGVVCLFDYARSSFFLWNPSTRNSTELPTMREPTWRLIRQNGFGWDRSRGAYKVFAAFTSGDVCVYSSETDSWKTLLTGVKTIDHSCQSGLFVGGSLHWFHYGQHDIESFDLEREAFGTIELPPDVAKWPQPWFHLGEIGGSLSILFFDCEKSSFEVWVMKEYGVKGSWLKFLTFPRDNKSMRIMIYGFRSQFGEGLNGEILLVSKAGFVVYSPKDATLAAAKHGISFRTAHVYVESLASPATKKKLRS